MDAEELQLAVSAYVRAYVRRRVIDEGATRTKVGAELGIGHSRVVHYLDTRKYGVQRVSPAVEAALADRLHGGSVDALRRAAAKYGERHPHELVPTSQSAAEDLERRLIRAAIEAAGVAPDIATDVAGSGSWRSAKTPEDRLRDAVAVARLAQAERGQ